MANEHMMLSSNKWFMAKMWSFFWQDTREFNTFCEIGNLDGYVLKPDTFERVVKSFNGVISGHAKRNIPTQSILQRGAKQTHLKHEVVQQRRYHGTTWRTSETCPNDAN